MIRAKKKAVAPSQNTSRVDLGVVLAAMAALILMLLLTILTEIAWFAHMAVLGATLLGGICAIHRTGRFSLTSQFVFLTALFLGSRFFLTVLNPSYPIEECFLFSRTVLTPDQLFEMSLTYVVMMFGVTLGIVFSKPVPSIESIVRPLPLKPFSQIALLVLAPLLLIMIYNSGALLAALFQHGYVAFFRNPENYLATGFAPHVISRLVMICIAVYLYSAPERIGFAVLALILFIGLLGSATGQRAPLFLAAILVIWLIATYNKSNVDFLRLATLGFGLIVIAQSMITLRSGYSYSLLEMPREFLHINGISICTLGYVVAYPELTAPGTPNYLLAPINDFFFRLFGGRDLFYLERSQEILDASGYLSYHLTYVVNPAAFFAGNGTGTSFIAEFYASFGSTFIIFPSIALGALLTYFDRNVMRNRFLLLMLPMVIYQIVYSPRDAIFKSIDNFVPLLLIFVVLEVFRRFLQRPGRKLQRTI